MNRWIVVLMLGSMLGCTGNPVSQVDLQILQALYYRPIARLSLTLQAQGSGTLQEVRFRGPDSLDLQVGRAFADGATLHLEWTVDTTFPVETYEVHLVGADAEGSTFEQVRTTAVTEVNGIQVAVARVVLTGVASQVFAAHAPTTMWLLGDARSYPQAVSLRWMDADGYRRYTTGDTTGMLGNLTVLAPAVIRDTVPAGSLYVVVEHNTSGTDTTELRLALFPLP
jgi:hypothetical protein